MSRPDLTVCVKEAELDGWNGPELDGRNFARGFWSGICFSGAIVFLISMTIQLVKLGMK